MNDDLRPSRIVAIFPFAVAASPITARQADLCRGFAVFLEQRLNKLSGVQPVLQNLFIAPENDPERKGWLMTNTMWTLDQALSLPVSREVQPTHLLQGQALWTETEFKVHLELIDLAAGYAVAQESIDTTVDEGFPSFFAMLAIVTERLMDSAHAGRLVARMPTKSPQAFESYLIGLAAQQAFTQEMTRPENALTQFANAIENDRHFEEACEMLEYHTVACLARGGLTARAAIEALEKGLVSAPKYLPFKARLGLALAERGQEQRALELMESYLDSGHQRGVLASKVCTTLARIHRRNRNTTKARTLLRAAIEVSPENAGAWEDLAAVHLDAGENAQAEECWRRALQEDPDRSQTLSNLGMVYLRRGDVLAAKMLFERAFQLPVADERARPNYIDCLIDLGKTEEADEVATEWAETEPENFVAWLKLARVRLAMNQRHAAFHCVQRAQERAQTTEQKALLKLEEFALMHPADFAEYQRLRTTRYSGTIIAAQAAGRLSKITEQHPGVAALWQTLMTLHTQAENWEQAAEAQMRYADLLAKNAEAFNHLGGLLLKSRKPLEASAAFDRAAILDPSRLDYRTSREEALAEIARQRAAINASLRTVEVIPAAPEPEKKETERPGVLRRLLAFLGRSG